MFSALRIDPLRTVQEVAEFRQKLQAGIVNLQHVGKIEYGACDKQAVYHQDKLTLYHFEGERKPAAKKPLLICYALVNTPWMVDLRPGRSLVENLLAQGEDVYLIDWGRVDGADRWLSMDDYINGYLDRCIDVICERHDLPAINLLGICQGGTFSLCYAALHPGKLDNMITMVSPVDFHTPDNMLSHWMQDLDVDLFVDTLGNIPADLMNYCYLMLKPMRLNQQKYVGLVDILDQPEEIENFLRMEKWIFDSPDQAGETFRQFIKDFYQGNKLIKAEVELAGQRVDLRNISIPVLNIFAEHDHLVPPAASRVLGDHVGTDDYTQLVFRGGHIGIYVSSRAQREVPSAIHDWLSQR